MDTIMNTNMNKVFTNIIMVICFFSLVYIVYNLVVKNNKNNTLDEPFENKKNKDKFINIKKKAKQINTIYETALTNVFGNNKRLLCSMIPTINNTSNICRVDDTPYIIYKFPIHMIKLFDDSILAVFNDGRMYQKYSMESTMWQGPILNSMPMGTIPLRMVTLGTDLQTLYGVGYDNILYVKDPKPRVNTDRDSTDSGDVEDDDDSNTNKFEGSGTNSGGSNNSGDNSYSSWDNKNGVNKSGSSNNTINITGVWKQVPNNSGIIYILFDNKTNYLMSIDVNGKLFTKTTSDVTSNNKELVTLLDRPVLRLYYDLNGYMLAIDNKFDLYQFTDIDWKTTPLQLERGANPSKVHDILYDNDGKLFGLVFKPDAFMVQIMKQVEVFYLSEFQPLDVVLSNNSGTPGSGSSGGTSGANANFVMSYQDIITAKIGSIIDYISNTNNDEITDDDPNFAYQKQIIETKAKLSEFCISRGSNKDNMDNYELLSDVENNDDKISKLKNVINNLMAYEPERMNIQDKYPILNG